MEYSDFARLRKRSGANVNAEDDVSFALDDVQRIILIMSLWYESWPYISMCAYKLGYERIILNDVIIIIAD